MRWNGSGEQNHFMRFIYFCLHSRVNLSTPLSITLKYGAVEQIVFVHSDLFILLKRMFDEHTYLSTPSGSVVGPLKYDPKIRRFKWFFSYVSRTGICPEWQIVVDISLLLIVLWNWTLACKCGLSSMPMMRPYTSFTKIHFCYPLKLRFFRFSLTSLLVWQ